MTWVGALTRPGGTSANSSSGFQPGTENVSFSITLTRPKRCARAAICADRWGPGPSVAMSAAVPKPAPGAGGVLVATAEPTKVAATATVIRARISNCWRHSWRSSRQAQRMTARRAGTPPLPAFPHRGLSYCGAHGSLDLADVERPHLPGAGLELFP